MIFLVARAGHDDDRRGRGSSHLRLFLPLEAYRLDILGSLTGIAAFSLLSFIDAEPWAWGLITVAVLALMYGKRIGVIQILALLGVLGLLAAESASATDIWSPYYRLTVLHHAPNYEIEANGVPHQVIQPERNRRAFYFYPYHQARGNSLRNVLIIGAGTGNDVATALAEGAQHVDAVEIDPELHRLGVQLNPDHPYQSKRVTAYVTDGRAFLEQTRKHYDLILFALPDSLTLVAGQSSLRLESYLFTLQAVQAAKAHLNPSDGVFAMYNYYRTQWLRDRLANTLDVAFGSCAVPGVVLHAVDADHQPPPVGPALHRVAPPGHGGAAGHRRPPVRLPGREYDSRLLPADPGPDPGRVGAVGPAGRAAAPDEQLRGPVLHAARRSCCWRPRAWSSSRCCSARPGLANALVFAGVLVAVLAAVEVSRRVVIKQPAWLYLALLAVLAVAWSVPLSDALLRGCITRPRFGASHGARVRPDLHRQPGFRPAVPGGRGLGGGLRREPAGRAMVAGGVLEDTSPDPGLSLAACAGRRPVRPGRRHQQDARGAGLMGQPRHADSGSPPVGQAVP